MQNKEQLEPPVSQALDELQRALEKAATGFKDRCEQIGDERWRPMLSWATANMLDDVYGFPQKPPLELDLGELDVGITTSSGEGVTS